MQMALPAPVVPYLWAVKNSSGAAVDFFPRVAMLSILPRYGLARPLAITVERDESQILVKSHDLPLYGVGDTYGEAVAMLGREIESLYDDLVDDDTVTAEWVRIRSVLCERIHR